MAGLLGVLDYLRFIRDTGEPAYLADSTSSALTTGTWTLTANFASVQGNVPTINYVKWFLTVYGISSSTVITTTDVTVNDGTTTLTADNWPAPVAATATRGLTLNGTIFNPGKDGGMAVATGIANVIANIVNTGGAQTATGRLIAWGWP